MADITHITRTLSADIQEGEERVGEKRQSPYWLGRAKQEERDERIKGYVNYYGVLSVELLIDLLAMEPTPSSRRIIETRLQRLSQQKYIKVMRESRGTYYIDPDIRRSRSKPQNVHDLMGSRFLSLVDRSELPVLDRRDSREIRRQGGVVLPDAFIATPTGGWCVEMDTGEQVLPILRKKGEQYYRYCQRLMEDVYDVTRLRVLFITKKPGRVVSITNTLQGLGSGGFFSVVCEETLTLTTIHDVLD